MSSRVAMSSHMAMSIRVARTSHSFQSHGGSPPWYPGLGCRSVGGAAMIAMGFLVGICLHGYPQTESGDGPWNPEEALLVCP